MPNRVLVVDDAPENIQTLSAILRGNGYQVVVATDGAKALGVLEKVRPDLILLDVVMPDVDGYEVCRRIKASTVWREIPVIFLTGKTETRDIVQGFESGAVDYVGKPFNAHELLARVKTHLELDRLSRQLKEQNEELKQKNDELLQAERRTRHVFSALAAALPGTVLDGKYRLEEKIGAGGFATVFRAEHVGLRQSVAVKVFRPWEGNDTPRALQRFRSEGVSACRVQHPNAVATTDFGISSSGIAYLVMELLRGVTVAELLQVEPCLPLARCIEILVPVCEVLAAAHAAGVVHRDIKPANVFLHRTPGRETVKVLDFGIAKLIRRGGTEDIHATHGVVGTPGFVAPERVMGLEYGERADVYSVGVMLYWMLSGNPPFPARDDEDFYALLLRQAREPVPALRVSGLPKDALRLVQRTLAKDADERPTARQLAAELSQLHSP